MSLNLETLVQPKNETMLLETTASKLIATVIRNLRETSLSSNTGAAIEAIKQLDSDRKNQLLVKYGGSLRRIKRFPDAAHILEVLTTEAGAE